MHDIALIDETLDINLTSTYSLSIQASLDGFSFSILDTIRNKFIVLKHIDFKEELDLSSFYIKIEEIIAKEELLKADFKNVKVIFSSSKSILIPSPLFDKENLALYFQFNHRLNKSDNIHHYRLKNTDANIVFTIPVQFEEIFKKKYSNIKFYNQSNPFIENILINNKNKHNNSKVLINVNTSFFDIAVIDHGSLILHNSFLFKNEKDFIYFVMYIYEQLKLNPEFTEIILSGDIFKNDTNYKMIHKYIRHIKFDKLSDNYGYSYTFNNIPSHIFTNLINLYRCE